MKKYLIWAALIIVVVGGIYFVVRNRNSSKQNNSQTASPSVTSTPTSTTTTTPTSVATTTNTNSLADPIADFKSRVTKKPFGIYITPQTSPIQPERFTGYHTGADVEYQDVTADVPVYAVSDGKVVLSETASGYGGVFMIEIQLNGAKHTVLYGHIRPSSLPKVGTQVTKSQQLAVLGTGYSTDTDGERRHLHFAVLADNSLNIKGYVSTKSQLSSWIDPLTLY